MYTFLHFAVTVSVKGVKGVGTREKDIYRFEAGPPTSEVTSRDNKLVVGFYNLSEVSDVIKSVSQLCLHKRIRES